MKKNRRIITFAALAALIAAIGILVYRGTGTGYVRTVSGVSVPWSCVSAEHHDCDYGHFSVYQLSDDSIQNLISDYSFEDDPPGVEYENDCLTFSGLAGADPIPSRAELIWMHGAKKYADWRMYLHAPTKRLFVAIGHADMSGDLPEGAIEHHE